MPQRAPEQSSAPARLSRALAQTLDKRREKLTRLARLQESLSHHAVLMRGFALVRDESGALVRSIAQAPSGARLDIEVADGRIAAQVDGAAEPSPTDAKSAPWIRKTRGRSSGGGQGSLF